LKSQGAVKASGILSERQVKWAAAMSVFRRSSNARDLRALYSSAGIILISYMNAPLYALVAYVRNSAGEFIENLRRDLHPEHPDLAAHLTILPPRHLLGSETEACDTITEVCSKVNPFEVGLGDVESFIPITPTIFIRVAHAAYRVRELHDQVNTGPLFHDEQWPFMPHLTIIKLSDVAQAAKALETARESWAEYQGSRRILIDEVTFVRGGKDLYTWDDLAPIPLGKPMAVKPTV
jgi:2'-5' RNA ligase